MVNITHKTESLRQAIATAIISVSSQATIDAVLNKTVPKGDVFEFSRAAGLLAIKKTSDVIPDCHPLPIEYAAIRHEVDGLNIHITVEVHTIYKTGVEVEAMHGAAITALTMYDMLKPLDKAIEVSSIKLLEKKGGKSDKKNEINSNLRIAVIVCSDTIAAGINKDKSGEIIIRQLSLLNLKVSKFEILSDDINKIRESVLELVAAKYDLILLSGGTGLSPRDVTPEAITPLIERELPGISEALRRYGSQRTAYAILSRGVAGMIANTVVITIPGSPNAAKESIDAIFPQVLHIFSVIEGARHQ